MRTSFLKYEEMRRYFPIYEKAVSHMTLQHLYTEFPYIQYEESLIFLSVYCVGSTSVFQVRECAFTVEEDQQNNL
jgi:hypothetical protein